MVKFKVIDTSEFSLEENVIALSVDIEGCFDGIAIALREGVQRFEIVLPNNNTIEVDARYCDFGSWEDES